MASLGDLTPTAQDGPEAELDTFVFYGVTFRMRPRVGVMAVTEYAHIARKGVQVDDVEGLDAMRNLVRQCVVPEDWQAFLDVCDEHNVDTDTVFGVVKAVLAAVADRPSLRLSDSPAGSTSSDTTSRDDSSSPGSGSPTPSDGPTPSAPPLSAVV